MQIVRRKLLVGVLLLTPVIASAARIPETGIRLDGGVRLFFEQDDNVTFRESDPIADDRVVFNPWLALSDELGSAGDRIGVDLDYRQETYGSESNLDNDEYDIAFDGVKRLGRSQRLQLTVEAGKSVSNVNSPESFGAVPDTIDDRAMRLSYHYHRGVVPLRFQIGQERVRYDRFGVGDETGDPRDRDESRVSFRAAYAPASERRQVYLQATRGTIIDRSGTDESRSKDAGETEWLVGFRYATEGLMEVEAGLGLYTLRYDSGIYDDVDETVHRLRLRLILTPLTTLRFDSDHRFKLGGLVDAPGYLALDNTLTLEQSIGRDLTFTAYLGRGTDSFVNSDIEDRATEIGLMAHYRIGKHLGLVARFSTEERSRSRVDVRQAEQTTVERRWMSLGVEAQL